MAHREHTPGAVGSHLYCILMLVIMVILGKPNIFWGGTWCKKFENHCPRGHSSKFPWKGMSQVMYVNMVPWVANETLHPLGFVLYFGCKPQTKKWMTYFPGTPLYCGRAGSDVIGCRRPTCGVFVCILQTRVTLTTFPIATPRGRSVSFPTQGAMVTYVAWDVTDHVVWIRLYKTQHWEFAFV